MSIIGVYDDDGTLVPYEDVARHFGVDIANLIKYDQVYPECLKDIDASPSRLIGPKFFCPYKTYLHSRLRCFVHYKALWNMNRGSMIHEGIKNIPGKEHPIKSSFVDKEGIMYTVGGVMDGVDFDNHTIYEIKTTTEFSKELPKKEHLYQTRIYQFLAHIQGKELNQVIFYYVTNTDWKRIVQPIQLFTHDEMINDVKWYRFCKENPVEGPRPEGRWFCASCDYWRFCKYSRNMFKMNKTRAEKISLPSCRECDKVVTVERALVETPKRVC